MQDYFGNLRNLRQLLGLEGKVDTARPIQWDNEMRENGNHNLIPGTVWSYQTNGLSGVPINTYVEFCTRKGQQLQEILNLAEHICDNGGEVNPYAYQMLREALEDFQEPVKRHYLAYGSERDKPTMTHADIWPVPCSEDIKINVVGTLKIIARSFVAGHEANLTPFETRDKKPLAWAMVYTMENGRVTGSAYWCASDPKHLEIEGHGYDDLHDFNPYS